MKSTCPHADGCQMYEVFRIAGALEVWKVTYCETGFAGCERYKAASAGRPVPNLLLPNGKTLSRPPGRNGA